MQIRTLTPDWGGCVPDLRCDNRLWNNLVPARHGPVQGRQPH